MRCNDGSWVLESVRVKKVIDMIPTKSPLLDIGCSDGEISNLIKRTKNVEVIGIDRAVWSKNINIPFIRCDVGTGLPFRDSTFHCIFAGEVIEHVYDTDFLIEECYRVLKHGGSLILVRWFK